MFSEDGGITQSQSIPIFLPQTLARNDCTPRKVTMSQMKIEDDIDRLIDGIVAELKPPSLWDEFSEGDAVIVIFDVRRSCPFSVVYTLR